MKPTRLHAVSPPKRPSYSLVRKAARNFKGSYAPREERHRLIKKWLAEIDRLGEKWVLAEKHSVKRKEA